MAEPADFVQYQTDHDVLIELRTEMRGMRNDVTEIKTNTVGRISSLENERISKKRIEDIEADIDSLKLWRSALAGAWVVCTILLIPLGFAWLHSLGL
jgi:hypothetical protein